MMQIYNDVMFNIYFAESNMKVEGSLCSYVCDKYCIPGKIWSTQSKQTNLDESNL